MKVKGNDKSTIVDAIWFTPMAGKVVGIIKVEVEGIGEKYYIGPVASNSGGSEEYDALWIYRYGTRFRLPKDYADGSQSQLR